jgi:hypothetical protein
MHGHVHFLFLLCQQTSHFWVQACKTHNLLLPRQARPSPKDPQPAAATSRHTQPSRELLIGSCAAGMVC